MKFAGTIGEPAAPPKADGPTRFQGGWLDTGAAHSPLAREGDMLCVALGKPSFIDSSLAALAASRGAGPAWIEAFHRFGAAAAQQAGGRFSVVVIDPEHGKAFLATDRFGTWPVCWAQRGAALAFSDRADAVPAGSRRLAAQSIFDYLYFHCIPAPSTVYEGVFRLPAAHALMWDNGRLDCSAYWQAQFDENSRPDLQNSKRQFLDIVRRSVAAEAQGSEPGTFLSGGTDSSTVTGMLCQLLGRPARAYSIGFHAAGYDEMEYARIAAKHFGADHREYYVTAEDLLQGLPKVAAHYDQPFGNSSAVPAWICTSRARDDGIDKMLAGDGGDELFGGNARYAKQRVFGLYDRVPAVLRTAVLEPILGLPAAARMPVVKKGASYVQQARVPMPDRMQMYNLLTRLGPAQVLEPAFLSAIDLNAPLREQRKVWQASQAGSAVNRMLSFDWKYTLADNDLPKVIGSAELAGMDVGFPLLSDELLAFSLALPPQWKLKGLTLRWFFKEALRGFLPDAIITKKKHGFGLPFGVWACSHAPLMALTGAALQSLKTRGIVRAEFIDALQESFLPAHPGYYGEMVWILTTLELWLQAHQPAWRLDRN